LEDHLARLQLERGQARLLYPAAVVTLAVRGVTRDRPRETTVTCDPVATLAGAAALTRPVSLRFVGEFDCGLDVQAGHTLVCPLATLDPPAVPKGRCPGEFRDGGGIIPAFGRPRAGVAGLFSSVNGRLAARGH